MKQAPTPVLMTLRALAVAASLVFSAAHADEYSDVSQLVKAGKMADALAKADVYLAGKPRDPQMRFLKGVILRESGKTSDAIATFTRLTDDFPELPEPYNNLAVLYAGQGQYDKARTALEMAIRTNPSYSTAHENLGDVYAKLASQAYNKALQLDSSNSAVAPKLALIRDLFNPGAKGQRPNAAPTLPTLPAPAVPTATAPAVGNPVAPTLGAAKVPPVLPSANTKPAAVTANNTAPATAATATATATTTTAAATPPAATTATAAPTPVAAAPAPAPAPNLNKEAEAAVRAWASAWAAKDVKSYLGAYGKEFDPPGNMKRSEWESERKDRITSKSSISVKLEGLNVSVNGNKATARFRQDYKANGLAVSSRKTLELVKNGDRWQIVRESTGG